MRTLTATAGTPRGPRAAIFYPARLQPDRDFLDGGEVCTYTVLMSRLRFSWNRRKSADNERKHGVSFEEAQTVFYDEEAKIFHDPDHSIAVDRFILLGVIVHARLLVVCHSYRVDDTFIRMISASKATGRERKAYLR